MDIEESERASVFEGFRSIDSYDYLDLYIGYSLYEDRVTLSSNSRQVNLARYLKDPPILGNEACESASNTGNAFQAITTCMAEFKHETQMTL